ncbi:MAG: MBL fold metallo-hydrolase [Rhodospirillales bacterium]|jgi:ribonuclease BN (tRNA processing enzyme)|nr:MBL fold metallo-hydrolase [Rhodospirillales bacterium]
MKLTLLGTGSPVPSVKKCSAGYMIETGKDVVLMDVGPGTVYRLLEAGKRVTDVTHVLLSHLHFDHWLDLIRLVLTRWDTGHPDLPALKVYAPSGINHIFERLFGPDGALKLDITARTNHPQSLAIYEGRGGSGERPGPMTEVIEIGEGDVIEGETWKVSLANVPHCQPYLISFGMRMEADGGILAYSSDITCNPENGAPKGLYKLANNADVLVQYVNVFGVPLEASANQVSQPAFHSMIAELARDTNVGTLVTTHHGPHVDRDGIRERIIAEIGAIYPGRVVWGQDLMTFEVGQT